MANGAEHDLGLAHSLEAEAIGPPGERRFRIRAVTDDATASFWLEKDQVSALATAIQRVLAQHRRAGEERRPPPPPLSDFSQHPTFDLRVGRLALAYDGDADVLAIYITDMESETPEHPTIRTGFSRQVARVFAAQAEETVAAGRPLCPLCEQSLADVPHLCPPANGHSDDALRWLGPPSL